MRETKDIFEVYTWPEVKYFIQFNDFLKNAVLISDKPLTEEYGISAFLVRKSWVEGLKQQEITFTYE